MLILDDLQWADTSTALLLGHMLQDIEATNLLVVGTIRESGGHRADELTELISRLYRDPGFERIALEGLDATETRALVHAAAEREASGSFILKLQDGTEGNPFFIKETLRSLVEVIGDASEFEDETLGRVPVPEGIRELIGTRLARLGETASQVLTPASVVGREFRLEVLEALLDEPVERIISALEEADEAGPRARGGRRRRPLRVRPRAGARDALRVAVGEPPRCACTTGSRRRWRTSGRSPRPPSSPTTTSRAATWTARARPSTTASRRRSRPPRRSPTRRPRRTTRRRSSACTTTRRAAASC